MLFSIIEKIILTTARIVCIAGSLLLILVIDILVRARIFTLDQVFSYFNMTNKTVETNHAGTYIIQEKPLVLGSQKATTTNKLEYTPQKPKPIKPPTIKSPPKPGWRKRDLGIKPRENGRK